MSGVCELSAPVSSDDVLSSHLNGGNVSALDACSRLNLDVSMNDEQIIVSPLPEGNALFADSLELGSSPDASGASIGAPAHRLQQLRHVRRVRHPRTLIVFCRVISLLLYRRRRSLVYFLSEE